MGTDEQAFYDMLCEFMQGGGGMEINLDDCIELFKKAKADTGYFVDEEDNDGTGWWRLVFTGVENPSDLSRAHIGRLVSEGYTSGEIVELKRARR